MPLVHRLRSPLMGADWPLVRQQMMGHQMAHHQQVLSISMNSLMMISMARHYLASLVMAIRAQAISTLIWIQAIALAVLLRLINMASALPLAPRKMMVMPMMLPTQVRCTFSPLRTKALAAAHLLALWVLIMPCLM